LVTLPVALVPSAVTVTVIVAAISASNYLFVLMFLKALASDSLVVAVALILALN